MAKLIIGGAGFVGSHLAKALKDRGDEIYILDDFSRGRLSYLQHFGLEYDYKVCDLRNYHDKENIIKDLPKIDTAYHCACRIGGMQFLHGSPEKEFRALNDNLAIDRNVFDMCRKYNIKNIVYTSSISVYNAKNQRCPDAVFSERDLEEQKLDPEGGYGWAKYIGEKQLSLMRDMGFNIGIARIFKSYGPCDDYSPESGQVVLSLMRKVLEGQNPLEVWGDGTATRNLVYIDDLIKALLKLEGKSLTVNIGGDYPVPMGELAREIVEVSGKNIGIKFGTRDQNGPQSRIPTLSRIKRELDWRPETNLTDGLRKCWSWMQDEHID
jgi:nucleoside-diphosphate-sugar epimerase